MAEARALIVIDMQRGFQDGLWGEPSNPQAEANVVALVEAWRAHALGPLVVVRHDSGNPDSPLAPGTPGNALIAELADLTPELLVSKQVNSAFYGEPSLHDWLTERGISELVMCGIQTNMCVETSARMAGNLGYSVTVPLDATRTFAIDTELADGTHVSLSADELMRSTAASLHGGGFATVTSTAALLSSLPTGRTPGV